MRGYYVTPESGTYEVLRAGSALKVKDSQNMRRTRANL